MSNLIKSFQYVPVDTHKQLRSVHEYGDKQQEEQITDNLDVTSNIGQQPSVDEETLKLKEEMLHNAKEFAERQIREAAEEAERILQESRAQIEAWWEEKRLQDEHLVEALRSEGFKQGYDEGCDKAQKELQEQVEIKMLEAQAVLNEAYQAKEQIIQEAEPFLVELSSAIAEKIIDRQLTEDTDLMLDLIKKNLSRKREQGVITLCVAPSQFSFVQAAREELSFAIDSQAELKILPDASVKDRGCVIRSAYGSVDARIDTQLTEIKKELIRVALDQEERGQYEGA
ncbi:FliH/SctL family protein [Paenibacillus urinalis]|uniref:FliH/SctL family protein n=1 Tax=Paenibacillus urinalis TaxID=521520 RepID=A0AAX3N3P1_9BACL|nr:MULTISPECIES: FliH/SctL family protein [Paenibacillus]WDH84483.1 FliH/SctL family protein [Paenibacillus urinalis]WDH95949.1 FliH/SctL family protein [Paenibacillus urinalis]WDI04167.1 FliH/SctL family protein [Paenibacillus urinalis]GAK38510.1 flagellar biosynthesis/type III secretory pathway protein [Paenibacillus sp. TCA20]